MSINAWVDQGDEINGSSSDYFADDLAMDACGTIIAAGNFGNASNISGFGYKYNSGTGAWINQSLNFAAGGGGASGGASAGGGAATAEGPESPEFGPETLEDREPKTTVNIQVQGDILSENATGERLVDLVNTAFNQQGVVVEQGIA